MRWECGWEENDEDGCNGCDDLQNKPCHSLPGSKDRLNVRALSGSKDRVLSRLNITSFGSPLTQPSFFLSVASRSRTIAVIFGVRGGRTTANKTQIRKCQIPPAICWKDKNKITRASFGNTLQFGCLTACLLQTLSEDVGSALSISEDCVFSRFRTNPSNLP